MGCSNGKQSNANKLKNRKLTIGNHSIKIDVVDNVGNQTYIENQFYIKE